MNIAEYNVRLVIETVLRNHPEDCIFTPNVVDNVIKKLDGKTFAVGENGPIGETFEDFIVSALEAEEIYCPHEGVDRRDEYYANVNTAGWSDWSAIAHEMI